MNCNRFSNAVPRLQIDSFTDSTGIKLLSRETEFPKRGIFAVKFS
jgi:hypothetical protein